MFGLGLAVPLIGGVALLGVLGGMYQCVHQQGVEDAEARNLRKTIEVSRDAQHRTTKAYARVTADLAGERERTTALQAEIARIGSQSDSNRIPDGSQDAPQEPGTCSWQSPLPWGDT